MSLRRRHSLDAGAHDIVEYVLCGERPAARLAMRAQRQRLLRFRIEILDELRPDETRGAHLGDFHEKIHADRPEERQPRRELIDGEPRLQSGAEIFDAIGARVW